MSHTPKSPPAPDGVAAQCPTASTAQGIAPRWWQHINWTVPLVAVAASAVTFLGAFLGQSFRLAGNSPSMVWVAGGLSVAALVAMRRATPRQQTHLAFWSLGYAALVIAFYFDVYVKYVGGYALALWLIVQFKLG